MTETAARNGVRLDERECAVVLGGALVIQALHMVEHVAQVIQKFALHVSKPHGIIGVLDLEWVHFFYNAGLLLLLAYLAVRHSGIIRRKGGGAMIVFYATLVWQSYHMVEHVVKILQHIETGLQGTPGVLGTTLNVILLHFYMNLGVLVGVGVSFFWLGMHRQLLAAFAGKREASASPALGE